MKIRKWIAAALVFLCGTATVHAQDYPNRPITLVVPFAAAGPGDIIARLVAARSADGGVKAVQVERLLQSLRLPHVGMDRRAVVERVDPRGLRLRVLVDDQLHPGIRGRLVAQRVHRAELPGCVDMEQRKGRARGMEGLARQMQHHRGILADAIQHYRIDRVGDDLAHDMDALRLQRVEMGEGGQIPVVGRCGPALQRFIGHGAALFRK